MLMSYYLSLVEIDTKQGKLMIRPYMMSGTISKYFDPYLFEPREFAVFFLHEIIFSPEFTIEEVSRWDDATIEQVLELWLKEQTEEIWKPPDDVSLFEGFQNSYREYVLHHTRRLQEIIANTYAPMFASVEKVLQQQAAYYAKTYAQVTAAFNVSLEPLIKSINESINLMANSVVGNIQSTIAKMAEASTFSVPTIDLGRFFENLPDFTELAQRVAEHNDAAIAIDEDGYPFLRHYWTLSDFSDFVGVNKVDSRVKSAVITNKLLTLTRQTKFSDEMKILFEDSQIIGRRWNIVMQALMAHQNRQYAIAIPTLLAQVEGLFTDVLVLKEAVKHDNGKFYARDYTGAIKLGKKGRPVQLHGLDQKVKNSDLQGEPLLKDLARFFIDNLVSRRNDIMHGRIVGYDKAKLSVQLVLAIYVLALVFNYVESDDK